SVVAEWREGLRSHATCAHEHRRGIRCLPSAPLVGRTHHLIHHEKQEDVPCPCAFVIRVMGTKLVVMRATRSICELRAISSKTPKTLGFSRSKAPYLVEVRGLAVLDFRVPQKASASSHKRPVHR